MDYVLRILSCFSLFFCFFASATTETVPQKPQDSPYLSSEKVEHWILIHGTFARALPWYKKGGSGYEALFTTLTSSKKNFAIHSFSWTGYNNHKARTAAAQELLKLLQKLSSNNYHTIHIIAHSHGGTVALLAAHTLASLAKGHPTSVETSSLCIKELFTLGMPVHTNWYPQAWDTIDTLYHLFSYGDFVQPVLTIFERMLPDAPNIYNLPVKKNNEGLWHETLRSADMIMQLPSLHTLLNEPGNYCLHLDTKSKEVPFLTATAYTQEEKEKDLAIDHAYIKQILTSYADSRMPKFASLKINEGILATTPVEESLPQ
jgi:pimeloyl-ACP methyl ester carboxylesterase